MKLVHKCKFGNRWQSCNNTRLFKNSRWWTTAILKILFDHNSAVDCSISVKFCVRKQFFHRIWQYDRYHHSTERIFCFPNAAWQMLLAAGDVNCNELTKHIMTCFSQGKNNHLGVPKTHLPYGNWLIFHILHAAVTQNFVHRLLYFI